MRKLTFLFIGILLVLFSCSSDPCEDVTCVNGSCVDGTCECVGDFIGPSCDQLPCENGTSINGLCDCSNGYYGDLCDKNFFGIYHSSKASPVGCDPDFVIQNPITTLDEEERLCYQIEDGTQLCFWFRIWIEEDLSYTLNLNQIFIDENGNASLLSSSLDDGTIFTSGNLVSLGIGPSPIILEIENDKFTIAVDADDCQLSFDFIKIQ